MNDTLTLEVQKRENTGRHASSKDRANRLIPAVIYGHGTPTTHVIVDRITFERVYQKAGESTLVELQMEGSDPVTVLIQDVQMNPVSRIYSHIDFHQVRMDEKIKAEVAIEFTGVAPAVKELGGVLLKNMDHLELTCLPADLPHEITVDISSLKTFEDHIRVENLTLPKGVECLNASDDIIASVLAPRSAEELDALNEAIVDAVDSVEVAGAKKEKAEEADEK